MSKDLERALSKLRFDDQVLGYSLMTRVGRPFVSFAFPDDLFPRVKDSIQLYKTDLRLMTIDTEKGLVVLSPVDNNWILTVLYVPELQLGLAIAKTKNVLRLLEGIELPPPPVDFEESSEENLQVLESIAIQAASVEPKEPAAAPTAATPSASPAETAPPATESLKPEDFSVTPSTVPERGSEYSTALSLDSELNSEMKKTYRNFGFDVLMLVDGNNSVEQIADSMFQPTDRVIELLKWGACRGVVSIPRAEAKTAQSSAKAGGALGRYVKVPKFEGDLGKVDGDDLVVIRMCDGKKTTEEIAQAVHMPVPKVVQIVAKYRKRGLRMIGKTV
ncbi:MAG: hypothetical protein ACTSV3_04255 [Candidatus Thorarchaeota archaeon]|nr:MAG: hypothetical protein DRP09_02400 [Candidatus Thorarchaeota archaeon]RLI59258.1 MAG: hypothetical protein DRO87_03525 [Candidatus Thorarchaeota archaeon]